MKRIALSAACAAILTVSPAAAGDWTGLYIGGQFGFADADTSGAASLAGDGLLGGIHAGYDHDFGGYVIGAEVDYDAADVDLTGATIDSIARLKLRLGADLGQTLIYGTAGIARVDASVGQDNGHFIGLGAGWMLRDNVSLGTEILWHEFDNIDGSGINANATTLTLRASFRF